MNAKRFFYVCAGLLLLVVAYTLGASKAQSQGTTNKVVGVAAGDYATTGHLVIAMTENGDWYWNRTHDNTGWPNQAWMFGGNVFGGTISTQPTSWSKVKGDFKK